MVNEKMAEELREKVQEIIGKELTLKQIQDTLNYHTNPLDGKELMIEQLQNRKSRGLIGY